MTNKYIFVHELSSKDYYVQCFLLQRFIDKQNTNGYLIMGMFLLQVHNKDINTHTHIHTHTQDS